MFAPGEGQFAGGIIGAVFVLWWTAAFAAMGLPLAGGDGPWSALAPAASALEAACILATCGSVPPAAFRSEAERTGTPVLVCAERSSAAITALHTLLDERLAPKVRMHGVLVDIFEIDLDTGKVTPIRHVAVDDAGTIVNPHFSSTRIDPWLSRAARA